MAVADKWVKIANAADVSNISDKIGTSTDPATAPTVFGELEKMNQHITTVVPLVIDGDYEFRIYQAGLSNSFIDRVNVQGEGFLDTAFLYFNGGMSAGATIIVEIDGANIIHWQTAINVGLDTSALGITQKGSIFVSTWQNAKYYLDGLLIPEGSMTDAQGWSRASPIGGTASKTFNSAYGCLCGLGSLIHFKKNLVIRAIAPDDRTSLYAKYWLKVRGQ